MIIDLIAGARPNFVKIAALIHANNKRGTELNFRVIHTGQHYDELLSGSFFKQLLLPEPFVNLASGSGSQAEQTSAIMIGYEKVLQQSKPDLCIVVGDVNSSMACAITAKKMMVKVAHIEAGIRSNDWEMPEEVNRVLIDSIADYFFTTTNLASEKLLLSGIDPDKIFFVGNTMIDTLLKFKQSFIEPKIWEDLKLKEKNYLVVTLHRPANVDESSNFEILLEEIVNHSRGIPILFPVHPRTEKAITKVERKYNNLHFIPPLNYLEFNFLIEKAKAVITDSGGITEETTVLNVPCLTWRTTTERPETITAGTNFLLEKKISALAPALDKIFSNNWKKGITPDLWDGKAGERILSILTVLKI